MLERKPFTKPAARIKCHDSGTSPQVPEAKAFGREKFAKNLLVNESYETHTHI